MSRSPDEPSGGAIACNGPYAGSVRREPGLATVDWASSLDTVAGCTLKRRATSAADFCPELIIWMASRR